MARSESTDRELVRAVWITYLETCRKAVDYETVEPFAWARLQEHLDAIKRRKKR